MWYVRDVCVMSKQFIWRERLESEKLVTPLLAQTASTLRLRYKLVEGRYFTLKQRDEAFKFGMLREQSSGREGSGRTEKGGLVGHSG